MMFLSQLGKPIFGKRRKLPKKSIFCRKVNSIMIWICMIQLNCLHVTLKYARGVEILEPALISIFQNARCTSVDVERFFSVLKALKADRPPNILPEAVLKLMFVRYNDNL